MKTLVKLILATALLAIAFPATAASSRGYGRSSGSRSSSHSSYVYRNPHAAYPSVSVRGYNRSSGTYVAPHVRTPANETVKDNLSYRGYGTIRVLRD